jgi:hypothetical protein
MGAAPRNKRVNVARTNSIRVTQILMFSPFTSSRMRFQKGLSTALLTASGNREAASGDQAPHPLEHDDARTLVDAPVFKVEYIALPAGSRRYG